MHIDDNIHRIKAGEYKKSRPPVVSTIIIWVIFIGLIIFGGSFLINNDKERGAKEAQEKTEKLDALFANRQPTIDRLAPQYCRTHQRTVTTFEDTSYPSNDGSGWTDEECKIVIGLLYSSGSDVGRIESVVNSRFGVGMTRIELWYSLGNPDKVNHSNYGGKVTDQLVYGYDYIYIENDRVTSYQTSR